MVTREDNLKIVYRTDGSSLVEFEDGTRITSFYAVGESELASATTTTATTMPESSSEFLGVAPERREKYVKVECAGFASTIFNARTSECTLALANGTLVACEPHRMVYNLIYNTGEILDIDQQRGSVSFSSK